MLHPRRAALGRPVSVVSVNMCAPLEAREGDGGRAGWANYSEVSGAFQEIVRGDSVFRRV